MLYSVLEASGSNLADFHFVQSLSGHRIEIILRDY